MKRLLLLIILAASPLAAQEDHNFRQTLARVAKEREPGVMKDIYGEYPVSCPTFWSAVVQFLGPLSLNFPPYRGSAWGEEWHKIYPHVSVYLQDRPVFNHDPDAIQRLKIAAFLEAYKFAMLHPLPDP